MIAAVPPVRILITGHTAPLERDKQLVNSDNDSFLVWKQQAKEGNVSDHGAD